MDKVLLKELVDIYLGVTHTPSYVDKGIPFLSVKDISSGKIIFDDCKYISEEEYHSLSKGARPQIGDMLFCRVGTIGKPIIIPPNTPTFASYVSLSYLRNKSCEKCNLEYLKFWMCSNSFKRQVASNVKGASQVNLNTGWLSNFEVPLISFKEQCRAVEILNKFENLLDLKNKQIEQLDLLIKSRFVEMFGDPARNEKGWKTGNIRDIISDVRYGTSRKSSDNGKYPYLRMNNITYSGELDLTDTKLIDIPDDELEKCSVKRGDVLFNRTNSKELVGKTCLYNRDELMVLAGFIIRIRTNEKILPIFLSNYMNLRYIKDLLFSMAKNACGQANINAQELQNIGIYIPPLALQNQFAEFVEEVEKEKATVKQSLEWLNTLKASLMQDYFG